jgi:iron complex outermembrane receptor protein
MKVVKYALIFMSVINVNNVFAQEEIDEIIVTSSYIEQQLNTIHNPIHFLDGEDIANMATQSLGETLDNLLGVSSADYGAGVGQPIIRGMSGNRVKIMSNGRVNRDVAGLGADHVNDIDLNNIQQIEVVRGPSSIFYANGTSGGIINVVDNTIARSDFLESELRIGAEAQTVNSGNSGEFSYQNNLAGLNFSLAYKDSGFEKYEIPFGAIIHEEEEEEEEEHHEEEENPKYLANSDYESKSQRFGVSKTGDWGYFGASVRGIESLYGIPFHGEEHEEEEEGEEHEEERIYVTTDSKVVNLEGSYVFDDSVLRKIDYYYAGSDYSLIEQHAEEAGHEEEEEEEHHEEGPTTFKNDAKEYGMVVDFSNDALSQRAVLNMIDEEVSAIGHEAFIRPSDSSEFSIGYYASTDLDVFNVDLAIRLDRISRKGSLAHDEEEEEEEHHDEEHEEEEVDYFDKDFENSSLAVSINRDINEFLNVSMDLANVERAPSAIELFMKGAHLATGRYEVGNTNIVTESSRNIDLSVAYDRNGYFGNITYFKNNVDDYIYLLDSASKKKKLTVSNYKQKDAQLSGYEIELGKMFEINGGNLELSIARDSISGEFNDGTNIPRMSPERNIYSLSYSQDQGGQFNMTLKDVKKQNDIALSESSTKGYKLLDIRYSQKLSLESGTEISASVFGHNLLNEVARNHSSFVKNEVPLAGKNMGVSFSVKF